MPQCSFKKCKNHTRSRLLKKDGVSYFRFPRDPVQCRQWISFVARQKPIGHFTPSKGSVLCSNHFLLSDIYETTKGITRLRKTAIPQIETNDYDEYNSCDKKSNKQRHLEQPQINIEIVAEVIQNPTSSSTIASDPDTKNKNAMKKKLFACKRLIRGLKNKLLNLRKRNFILMKKYINLKKDMSLLKKRQTDQSLTTDIIDSST